MGDKRVRIIYEATDNASKVSRQVQAEVTAVQQAATRRGVGLEVGGVVQGLAQVESAATRTAGSVGQSMLKVVGGLERGLTGGLQGILPMLGPAGLIAGGLTAAGVAVVRLSNDWRDHADQIGRTTRAYQEMSGISATVGGRELREATGGAMTSANLMEASMRLMAVHLADSNKEAGELLNTAIKLGQARGLNPQEAVDNLVPLLSNQSALRLDEFMVSGDAVSKLKEKYVAAGMDSGKAFSKAFLEEAKGTLERLGDVEMSTKDRYAVLREELKAERAQKNAGILPDFREMRMEGMERRVEQLRTARENAEQYESVLKAIHTLEGQEGANAEVGLMARTWVELTEQVNQGKISLEGAMAVMADRFPAAAGAWTDWTARIHETDSAVSDVQLRLELLSARKYTAEVEVRVSGLDSVETRLADYANEQAMIGRYTVGTPQAQAPQFAWQQGGLDERMYQAKFGERDAAEKEARTQAKSAAKAAASEAKQVAEQQAREFRSTIEGLLQPTEVTALDMAQAKVGKYTEKWDEHVRRLRSAATDAKSQWRDLIPTDVLAQGKDAITAWAAEKEKAFYSGQNLEAVNWDAFLQQLQQQQAEKAGREALVNEAMRRAQEAGLGGNAGMVREALGVGSTQEESGTQLAQGISAGMAQQDLGAVVTASFREQLTAQKDQWVSYGKQAMGWFINGLSDLPAASGQQIAGSIAPLVAQIIARREARA